MSTHPVQYHVPWFRALASHPRIDLHVLYGLVPTPKQQGVGFGVAFQWDHDLLEGYRWSVLENRAAVPGLGTWCGVDTPGVGRALARLIPDVVLVCGWQARSLVQATMACRRMCVPVLVRGDSNQIRKRAWWVGAAQRWYLKMLAGMLVVGKSNAEFYMARGVSPDRLFSVPHFVPASHLMTGEPERSATRAAARARLGMDARSVGVLFCGKLQEHKRVDDLLKATARVHREGVSVRALVVGDGPCAQPLRALAEHLQLPGAFLGFMNQAQIGEAYAAADMFVLPSSSEAWGLVVNEAQVCSLPVIVSDQVGCGPDLVEDGVTGWTYPCGDVAALAERIRRLAVDPAARQRMGEAGRQRVAAYSVEAAVEGTVRAVEAVLARRGVRTGERA